MLHVRRIAFCISRSLKVGHMLPESRVPCAYWQGLVLSAQSWAHRSIAAPMRIGQNGHKPSSKHLFEQDDRFYLITRPIIPTACRCGPWPWGVRCSVQTKSAINVEDLLLGRYFDSKQKKKKNKSSALSLWLEIFWILSKVEIYQLAHFLKLFYLMRFFG